MTVADIARDPRSPPGAGDLLHGPADGGAHATIVNIALPAIHRSLGSSLAGLQWTVDAYTLVLASLLILAGSTADRVGRKRVFQVGLLVFSLGSLLCALAPTQGVLIAARVLQAIGGSMLSPVAMSIIRTVFVDPAERARAIGITRRCSGSASRSGPCSRTLVAAVGWRAVFLVNVPVGALAVVATHRFVPESRAERPRRVDPIGQILVIVGLASLTYGTIEGPDHGWASIEIVVSLAVAALAVAAFIRTSCGGASPCSSVRWFRSAPFSGASAIALCAFAALGAFPFLNTLYLQEVRGLSPLRAGLCMLPMAAMVLIFAPLSGRLVGGPRPAGAAGRGRHGADRRRGDADPAAGWGAPSPTCSSPTRCSGSASASSTRRSPTPPSPACPPHRPASPPPWPRPAARSA